MQKTGLVIESNRPLKGTDAESTVLALLILGLMCLCLGFFAVNLNHKFMNVDMPSLAFIIILLSLILLVLAAQAIKNYIITESVLMILSAFTAILYVITYLQNDTRLLSSIFLFAIGFICCAVIFKYRDETLMCAVSACLATTLLVKIILPDEGSIVSAILLLYNGVCFFLAGSIRLAGFKGRYELTESGRHHADKEGYPEVFVSTVGVLLFGIMSFSVGVAMIDESGMQTSFIAFKLFMGIIVLLCGCYALTHKIYGEGLTMVLVALSATMYGFSMLAFGHAPHYFDIILGLLMLPVIVAMIAKGNYLLSATALLLALVMIMEAFWEGSRYIEILVMLTKLVATAFSLITWFTYDIGSEPKFIAFAKTKVKGVKR